MVRVKFLLLFSLLVLATTAWALPVISDANLVIHLDAGAITGVSNGNPISTWADQSGNSYDATQSTTGIQPVYVASSVFNSLPAVSFDGTDDWMAMPETAVDVSTFTMFAVGIYDSTDPGSNQYMVSGQQASSGNRIRFCIDRAAGDDPQFLWRAGSSSWKLIISDADTATHIFGETSDVEGFLDGTSMGTATNTASGSPPGFQLGSYGAGEKDFFGGDIAEFILYDGVLSADDIAAVNDWLEAKYAPEPATIALLGLGGLLLRRRR